MDSDGEEEGEAEEDDAANEGTTDMGEKKKRRRKKKDKGEKKSLGEKKKEKSLGRSSTRPHEPLETRLARRWKIRQADTSWNPSGFGREGDGGRD